MSGPYETEREARRASLWETRGRDSGTPMDAANMADLAAALSGVDLGAYDKRIIAWLARCYEPATVAVVCGLISRARAAGEQQRQAEPEQPPPGLRPVGISVSDLVIERRPFPSLGFPDARLFGEPERFPASMQERSTAVPAAAGRAYPRPPLFLVKVVPWAEPGAGSFAELEALCMRWRQRKPDRLRCHPVVMHYLQRTVPPAEYPAAVHKSLFHIEGVVDPSMPYGALELLEGDEVLERGVAGKDGKR